MITNKRPPEICFILFCRRASIILAFLIVVLYPVSSNAFDILLGAGEKGTFSNFTARTICRILNRHADVITCKAVPTPDDVYNLTNLQGGSLDIVLIDSLMLHDAINKTGPFEFMDISYDNLRALTPLYDLPITLVVRNDAGIGLLEELKGKRINAGAPGSFQHLAVDTIMKAKNWSKQDFGRIEALSPSHSQDTMAFCHNTIQAMLHIGVHPDSSLQQLFRLCKAVMVNMKDSDIKKLVDDHPAYSKTSIAPHTYPSQPEGVTTFGTRVELIASSDLDEQTVYKIMDVIYSNQNLLKRSHPALFSFRMDQIKKKTIGLPVHPGAARYFKEKNF
ncbi:MAG: TAXI family TRAP transporter solute-binding subunit [Desulfobacterales bacterium]|nr:TAXI family TRAP transporter solute-binding subunit [Desulfobacterales bacterium]